MVSPEPSPELAQLCARAAQTAQPWLAPALSRDTACLPACRGFPDISTARGTTLAWESAAGEALCSPHHTSSGGNPLHREPTFLSGDQAKQMQRMLVPGSGKRIHGVWLLQIQPGAACGSPAGPEHTLGEQETAPVLMTVHTLQEPNSDPAPAPWTRTAVNPAASPRGAPKGCEGRAAMGTGRTHV